jgi:hypothetical protein
VALPVFFSGFKHLAKPTLGATIPKTRPAGLRTAWQANTAVFTPAIWAVS